MANRYWVGGTATWDATAASKWATTSGGAGGAAVPTAADDVFFDAASGANTVTLSTSTVARSINCTGFTGTLSHPASTTIVIGDSSAGAGSVALLFVASMTYTIGNAASSIINFASTSATQQTITSGGKTLGSWTISGLGSSYILTDANTSGTGSTTSVTGGTLDTNGQTCSWGFFTSITTNVRTLTFGSSSITITASSGLAFNLSTSSAQMANLTMTANTAIITLTGAAAGFATAPKNFNGLSVVFTGSGNVQWSSGNTSFASTVANLTRTGTAVRTDGFTIGAQVVVTGAFTVTGNSLINRVVVAAGTSGTTVPVTAGSVALTYVDFIDITAAGAAAPFTGTSLGDGGGNSNITFPAAVTRYAVAAGNWSSTSIWSTSSGGASGASVPLCHDAVFLNGSSGVGTINTDMARLGKDIDCTGYTGTLDFASYTTSVFGSLTLSASMTLTGNINTVFAGRGSNTITSAGKTFNQGLVVTAGNGTYVLQDSLITLSRITVNAGTLTTNNQAVTCNDFVSNSGITRTINLGTSTVSLTSAAAVTIFNMSATALTMNAASATITIVNASVSTRTFGGASTAYGTLNYTVNASVGVLDITGSNTFGTINISDATNAKTLRFTAGTTTTVTTFNVNGASGRRVTISSITAATHTLSKTSGTVSCDYLNLTNSIATGGAAWYAGVNSVNNGGNTGWIFTAPQSGSAGWFAALS